MRLTFFGLSPKLLDSFIGEPDDFKFVAHNFTFNCCKKAAIAIAPILMKIFRNDPQTDCFEIKSTISRPFLVLFFSTLKRAQIPISKRNAIQYSSLANCLENDELRQCITILTEKTPPSDFISYIIRHNQMGLTVIHDLHYVAVNFRRFYSDPSLSFLSANLMKEIIENKNIIENKKMSAENRRLLTGYYKKMTHQTNTLENYFIISSMLHRNTYIDLEFDGENYFLGIIANLTALAGNNNIFVNRTIFIEAPVPVHKLRNVVDLKNPQDIIRIPNNPLNYIQYDFRERKIALTSVSIQIGTTEIEAPKHWAILGSDDQIKWIIVLEHKDFESYTNAFETRNFRCIESPYFRFIRFVQRINFANDKRNNNVINISGIEFFGKLSVI